MAIVNTSKVLLKEETFDSSWKTHRRSGGELHETMQHLELARHGEAAERRNRLAVGILVGNGNFYVEVMRA